jgi:hypothetical protein
LLVYTEGAGAFRLLEIDARALGFTGCGKTGNDIRRTGKSSLRG